MLSNKQVLMLGLGILLLGSKCPDIPTPPIPTPTPTPIVLDCSKVTCPTGTVCTVSGETISCQPINLPPEEPPVPGNNCPVPLPDKSALTINARCIFYNPQTQKCVTDSTPRVGDIGNDNGYCAVVTGNPDIHSCKANPEGSGYSGCDTQFLGGPCSYWYWSSSENGIKSRCLPDGLGPSSPFSCDHFDGWDETQGEYTGKCERATTGLHAPITGFSTVPHGIGYAFACNKDASICSKGIKVDY